MSPEALAIVVLSVAVVLLSAVLIALHRDRERLRREVERTHLSAARNLDVIAKWRNPS